MPSSGAIMAGAAYLRISADSSEFKAGLNDVQSTFRKFAMGVNKWANDMQYIGMAVAAPITASVKKFEEFDTRMRKVQAVTHSAGAEFTKLSQHARQLGRDTSYTANEVADAMLELGRMGFNTREITDATQSVMNLARATGSELALAANTSANMLRVFGKDAKNTANFADIMVTTVNNSAQTLQDFADAVAWAGPRFSMVGEDFKTMATALGVMANMGIKGSMAGNSIARGLVQLSDDKVIKFLKDMDIEVVNANGDMKPYLENLHAISNAMAQMGTQQQMQVAKEVFGMRGMLGNVPLVVNTDKIDELYAKLGQVDGAANDAMKNIEGGIMGTLALLVSAFDDLRIEFGKVFFNTFSDFIKQTTDALKSLREFLTENREVVAVLLKFGAASMAIAGVTKAFSVLGYAVKAILSPVLAVQKAINNLSFNNVNREQLEAVANVKWLKKNYEDLDKVSQKAVAEHKLRMVENIAAQEDVANAENEKKIIDESIPQRKADILDNATKDSTFVRSESEVNEKFLRDWKKEEEVKASALKFKLSQAKQKERSIDKIRNGKEYLKLTGSAYRTDSEELWFASKQQRIDEDQYNIIYNKDRLLESQPMLARFGVDKQIDQNKLLEIPELSANEQKELLKKISTARSNAKQKINNYSNNIRNWELADFGDKFRGVHYDTKEEFEAIRAEKIADWQKKIKEQKALLPGFDDATDAVKRWNARNDKIKEYTQHISDIRNDAEYKRVETGRPLTDKQKETLKDKNASIAALQSSEFIQNKGENEAELQKTEETIKNINEMLDEEKSSRRQKLAQIETNKQAELDGLKAEQDIAKAAVKEAKAKQTIAQKAENDAGKIEGRARKRTATARNAYNTARNDAKRTYGDDVFGESSNEVRKRMPFNDYAKAINNGSVAMSLGQKRALMLSKALKECNNASLIGVACTSKHAHEIMALSVADMAAAQAAVSGSSKRVIAYYAEAAAAKVAAGATMLLQTAMNFLKGNWLTLAIAGITAAFSMWNKHLQGVVDKFHRIREDAENQAQKERDRRDEQTSTYKSLIDKYHTAMDENTPEELRKKILIDIVHTNSKFGEVNDIGVKLYAKDEDEFKKQVLKILEDIQKESAVRINKSLQTSLVNGMKEYKAIQKKLVKGAGNGVTDMDEYEMFAMLDSKFLTLIDQTYKPGAEKLNFSFTDFGHMSIQDQEDKIKRIEDKLNSLKQNPTIDEKYTSIFDLFEAFISGLKDFVKDAKSLSNFKLDDAVHTAFDDKQKKADKIKNDATYNEALNKFAKQQADRQDSIKLNREISTLEKANPFAATTLLADKQSKAFIEYKKSRADYRELITEAKNEGYYDGTISVEKKAEYDEKIKKQEEDTTKKQNEYNSYTDAYNKAIQHMYDFKDEQQKLMRDRWYSKLNDQQKYAFNLSHEQQLVKEINRLGASAKTTKDYETIFKYQQELQDTIFKIQDSRDAMIKNRQTEALGSYSASVLNRSISGDNYQLKSYQETVQIRTLVATIAAANKLNQQQTLALLNKYGVAY